MNMERMRADRTDQLAENIQRSLVGLKNELKTAKNVSSVLKASGLLPTP
jgi:hypothetical protein